MKTGSLSALGKECLRSFTGERSCVVAAFNDLLQHAHCLTYAAAAAAAAAAGHPPARGLLPLSRRWFGSWVS